MKKFIIISLLSTVFSQEATLSFGAVNLSNSTINIILNNTIPVSGFQFEVNTDSLITIETATGGSAETNGFTINVGINNDILLGYSTSISEIPIGEVTLTTLSFSGFSNSTICMSNALIVNGYTELIELTLTYGECITLQYISGDVNLDEQLNVADIVLMVSFILENTFPTEYELWSSDISEDGVINISDIVMTIYCIFNDCNAGLVSDCLGIVGGTAIVDECGVCGGTGIPIGDCDCFGNVLDFCGVCGGAGLSDLDCSTTDLDGNVYTSVIIGTQEWIVENLKTTHYNNGDVIPNITNNGDWGSLSTGAYGDYNNNPVNSETYGRLYNWYTVNDTRGVCPVDYHVPSDEEFKTLEMFLGMSQADADAMYWRGTNEGSKLAGNALLWTDGPLENNAEFGTSGFTTLPSGHRNYTTGLCSGKGYNVDFWSSTEYNSTNAWNRDLNYSDSTVGRYGNNKKNGFAVRCLRD